MYFLKSLLLFLLISTLTAAHNNPSNTTTPPSKAQYPHTISDLPRSLSKPTKTIILTITHTVNPPLPQPSVKPTKTALITTTQTIHPPLSTQCRSPSLPIIWDPETETETELHTVDPESMGVTNALQPVDGSSAVSTPSFTSSTVKSSTIPQPMFTLDLDAGVVWNISTSTSPMHLPTSTPTMDLNGEETEGGEDAMSSNFTSTATSEADGEDGVMSILPSKPTRSEGSLLAFYWPRTATLSRSSGIPTTTHDDPEQQNNCADESSNKSREIDNDTAWAGIDDALFSRVSNPDSRSQRERKEVGQDQIRTHQTPKLQGRSLPHLSPPPLKSKSAAVRRVQRVWQWGGMGSVEGSVKRAFSEEEDKVKDGKEKMGCVPCEEGKPACRGDVAIGVCKGGCVEFQFFGRGRGNGCEDD